MQASAFICPICLERYNLNVKLPKNLPCGHTLCIGCLRRILNSPNKKCPNRCERSLSGFTVAEDFGTNFAVVQIIEESAEWEICDNHGERLKYICLQDKIKICSEEALNDHLGHEIVELFTKVKPKLTQKREELEITLQNLKEYFSETYEMLEKSKATLLKTTSYKFEELLFVLKIKQHELTLNIQSFFDKELKRLDQILGEGSIIRKNIEAKIDNYKTNIKHPDLYSLIVEDISSTTENFKQEKLNDQKQKFCHKLEEVSRGLEKSLMTQIESLAHLGFPIEDFSKILNLIHPEESKMYSPIKLHTQLDFFPVKTCLVIKPSHDVLDIIGRSNQAQDTTEIRGNDWKSLTKVNIKLEQFKFLEEDMNLLSYISRRLEKISCVKINIRAQSNISEEQIINLFNILFWKPQDLKGIELNFDWSKIGDQTMVALSEQVLHQAVNLKMVKLNLYKTSITDKTLQALAKSALPKIQRVKNLVLNFGETNLTSQGISGIFMQMPNIRKCELGLSSTKINNDSLQSFTTNMLPSMIHLESLHLRLWLTEVTDDGLIQLLRSMRDIREIIVDLSETRVTDRSIDEAINFKTRIRTLKSFEMKVENTGATQEKILQLNRKILT